jgi:hypothetical protein
MVSEVIVHIGMHKTGSTSIQAALAGYDDGRAFYARFPETNHSSAIRGGFSATPENYHQWKKLGLDLAEIQCRRKQYREQLARDLARDDRDVLIISGEGIGLLDDLGKLEFLETARQHARRIRVVCYVRAPLEFAASYLQQNIKVGRRTLPPIVRTEYRNRLEIFAQQLPPEDLVVRAFDRASFPAGSVVADFRQIAGLESHKIADKSANESLSAPAIKLVYAFNRSNDCYAGDPVIHRARLAFVHWIQGAYSSGTPIDVTRFHSKADFSELEYLHNQFGLRLNDDYSARADARRNIDEWLLELDDIDPEPLHERLRQIGVNSSGHGIEWMLNRLYYEHLCEAAVRNRQFRITPDTISWALLRDVAGSFFVAAIRAVRRRADNLIRKRM